MVGVKENGEVVECPWDSDGSSVLSVGVKWSSRESDKKDDTVD